MAFMTPAEIKRYREETNPNRKYNILHNAWVRHENSREDVVECANCETDIYWEKDTPKLGDRIAGYDYFCSMKCKKRFENRTTR